jgi:hypothetical protein
MEDIKIVKYTPNARCFKVKYFGATNTQGSRIKVYDCRFKTTKWLPFNYEYTNGCQQVADYLKEIGIAVLFKAEFDERTDIIISDNFEVMLK